MVKAEVISKCDGRNEKTIVDLGDREMDYIYANLQTAGYWADQFFI